MRVETVVLFVPDVWSCLPTRVEWEGMIAAGSCKKPFLQQKHLEEMMDPEAQALTHYLVSFLFTILLLCRDCAMPHHHPFLWSATIINLQVFSSFFQNIRFMYETVAKFSFRILIPCSLVMINALPTHYVVNKYLILNNKTQNFVLIVIEPLFVYYITVKL